MKVLHNDLKELFKVIESRAKFQKVMVLYDDSISAVQVAEIYNTIKEICIFNKMDINNLNMDELNNGYRAIIYFCAAKTFLKLNFDKSEFINLCIVKGNSLLPYCLNYNGTLIKKDLYIFADNSGFDINFNSSLIFNKFYNYLSGVINLKEHNSCEFLQDDKFAKISVSDSLKEIDTDFTFLDLDIVAKTEIDLKYLSVLHLLLINAFILLLNNVKNKTLLLVDVYKVCREDYVLLDKLYAMANNEVFYTMINLNYNYLINLCIKTKEKILQYFNVFDISQNEVESILVELKDYAKTSTGIMGYLYLYDFFKV